MNSGDILPNFTRNDENCFGETHYEKNEKFTVLGRQKEKSNFASLRCVKPEQYDLCQGSKRQEH
jgi:hypothetical protein